MRPLLAVIVISLCTALAGCHRSHSSHAATPPVEPLPVVKAEDVPAPAQPTVVLGKGMLLGRIAAEAYGDEKFSGMLQRFNKIEDPARIKIGTVVKTPSIPEIFKEEKLDPKYQPAINVLAKAQSDFQALLPSYHEVFIKASGRTKDRLNLPAEMKEKLVQMGAAVDSAATVLAGATAPHKPPQATVMQFKQAANQLRIVAGGSTLDYTTDMVGQRMGLGMTNALIWVQQNYQ
jgi:hypothetical protein